MQALLRAGCAMLGIELTLRQVQQFEDYHHLLVEWNNKFNLTAITGYEDVQVKHFLDSLAGVPLLQEVLGKTQSLWGTLQIADIGTGAGLPAIPLKIIAPRLRMTLVDGTGKKITFLREVCQALGLDEVSLVQGRAEEIGQQPRFRGQFDLVTARAVAPLRALAEYLLPLVRRDGFAVVYKGANVEQELAEAGKAIAVLGGEMARVAAVEVPFLQEKRSILLIRKVRATPAQYPRGQGLARKKPIE